MSVIRFKVQLHTVAVLGEANHSEWGFKGTVRHLPSNTSVSFGAAGTYEVTQGESFVVEPDKWTLPVDVGTDDLQIEISVKGFESKWLGLKKRDLGSVKVTLNTPIYHGYDLTLTSDKGLFAANIKVEPTHKTPTYTGTCSTIPSSTGTSSYSTLLEGNLESKMIHICPVIPVPWASGIPPITKGAQNQEATDQQNLGIGPDETTPNALVNPSLIPVIDTKDLAFFNKHCARIYITQYRPKTLALAKLVWKAKTDNIRFYDGGPNKTEVKGGREVKAYGVLKGKDDEEGVIEVRWDEPGQPLLAVYRAWVGKPKYIWFRANIVKCSKASIGLVPITNPTTTPAVIKKQIAYSNVLLWQAGIKLVPDPVGTCYNDAVPKDDGIFAVTAEKNYTFNIPDSPDMVAPLLNQRARVFNAAYIHTVVGQPGLNGQATDRRLSAVAGTKTLGGSPSTSWVRPSGVYPDDPGKTITMKTMGPSGARDVAQKDLAGDKEIDKICACIMTQQGATLPGSVTLAHELGHVIGLHHRGCGGGEVTHSTDGVDHLAGPKAGKGHPWNENMMTYGPNDTRQDIDLIQTKVMRSHPLLRDVAKPPPPPPKPKKKEPVPPAGVPGMADRILLQEFLGGTRKGLKRGPYDLGKTGPGMNGVDGVVGPKTKAAIEAFQLGHGGLKVDGIYGPETQAAFDKEINGK